MPTCLPSLILGLAEAGVNPSNLLKTPNLPQWGGGQIIRAKGTATPPPSPSPGLALHFFITVVMDEFVNLAKVGASMRPVHKVSRPYSLYIIHKVPSPCTFFLCVSQNLTL